MLCSFCLIIFKTIRLCKNKCTGHKMNLSFSSTVFVGIVNNAHTGSGAQPASYPIGFIGSLPGDEVARA
jgi:hypothetical protein